MASKPILSIIIPTLNEEKYLPALLSSIARQTFRDYEVIVADSNSSDRTCAIAEEAGCRVVIGPKKGPGAGRNLGARAARGEILLFLDADVILPREDFLAQEVKEFSEQGLAAAGCLGRTSDGGLFNRIGFALSNLFMRAVQRINPHAAGWALFARRNLHEEVGGFDEAVAVGEDCDYVVRLSKLGKFRILRSSYVFVSMRRFRNDGFIHTLGIYFLSELIRPWGRIKHARLNYKFGHYK